MLSPDDKGMIRAGVEILVIEARDNAHAHDFPAFVDDTIPTGLMLIVTEVGEAMQEFRRTYPGEPMTEGFFYELADILIRVADLAGAQDKGDERLAEAVVSKMVYNQTRAIKHGGKRV